MLEIQTISSFADVPESAILRNSYPKQQNFFLSHDWFSSIYEDVKQDELEPRIYIASDGSDTIAILYCYVNMHARRLFGMTNYYSWEYSPVFFIEDTAGKQNAISSIFKYIASEKPRWRSLEFKYLKESLISIDMLTENLSNLGFSTRSLFQYDNWFFPIRDQDFESYYSARPSRLKNTIKRKQKKLDGEGILQTRIYFHSDQDLMQGISDYNNVYNKSWKNNEPHPQFIENLILRCAELNNLLLGVAYIDNQAVAAQIWIQDYGRYNIYKLAYDEAYKKFSVGSILSKKLFEIAFENIDVKELDYGVGSEQYKQEWMADVRKIYQMDARNLKTVSGRLASYAFRIRRLLLNIQGRKSETFNS